MCSATCECSFVTVCCNSGFFHNRLSARCTHVSAVLQVLTSIKYVLFNRTNPTVHRASDPDATKFPVISLPCMLKAPKETKAEYDAYIRSSVQKT